MDARDGLVEIGEPAVDALIDLMHRDDGNAGQYACEVLGEIRGSAPRKLAAILRSPEEDIQVKHGAALALALSGKAGALEAARLLRDEDPEVRYWGSTVFAQSIDAPDLSAAVPALIDALHDSQEAVRHHATLGLGKMGTAGRSAIPVLVAALRTENRTMRSDAAAALARLGVRAVDVPLVLDAMGNAEDNDLTNLCEAVAWLKGDGAAALPLLRKLLAHDDLWVRMTAVESIWRIAEDSDTCLPLLREQLQTMANTEPGWAMKTLAMMGPRGRRATEDVLRVLADSEFRDHHVTALLALERFGAARADVLKAVQRALKSPRDELRVGAARALWSLRGNAQEVLPTLEAIVRGETWPSFVAAAARTLGRMGAEGAPALEALRTVEERWRHEREPLHAARAAIVRIEDAQRDTR